MPDKAFKVRGVLELEEVTAPQPQPPSGDDFTDLNKWERTFGDEFNEYPSLWSYWTEQPAGTWKTFFYFGDRVLNDNGERQYYMDEFYKGDGGYNGGEAFGIDPFEVNDSVLSLHAEHSDPEKAQHYWGYEFTSGLITTEPSFSQKYGRFVIRAKMPKGSGLWPAFWLLPVDKTWPPEIDVLEFFGGPNSRGEGGVTKYHYGGFSGGGNFGSWVDVGADLTADFHVFAVEWDSSRTKFFFDDRLIADEATRPDWHKPMYMLANLAINGHWAEYPPEDTHFPAELQIDFIRAYRRRTRRDYGRKLPNMPLPHDPASRK